VGRVKKLFRGDARKMIENKLLVILGVILLVGPLIAAISHPLYFENEIDFKEDEIAFIDVLAIHYMLATCCWIGVILIMVGSLFEVRIKKK